MNSGTIANLKALSALRNSKTKSCRTLELIGKREAQLRREINALKELAACNPTSNIAVIVIEIATSLEQSLYEIAG